MTTLILEIPDDVKSLAEARAVEAGCADIGEYLTRLICDDAISATAGISIDSDEQLEALLLTRLDGRSVEMDAADFRRIREKFQARLDADQGPV